MTAPSVVSTISLVPVGADLTSEVLTLEVLRGLETAQRVDQKLGTSVSLVAGEWGVINSSNQVVRPGASSAAMTFLCFLGTDRFDVAATGAVTLFMNSPLLVKSSTYDTNGTYAVGTDLTVKSLSAGFAGVTSAATSDWVVGRVVQVGTGYLVYEVCPTPFKKPA